MLDMKENSSFLAQQPFSHILKTSIDFPLGNSPSVEFCGYTIPHPSEAKMNLRIQTYGTYFRIISLPKGFLVTGAG